MSSVKASPLQTLSHFLTVSAPFCVRHHIFTRGVVSSRGQFFWRASPFFSSWWRVRYTCDMLMPDSSAMSFGMLYPLKNKMDMQPISHKVRFWRHTCISKVCKLLGRCPNVAV